MIEDDSYDWSYSSPPPSYNQLYLPESLWLPYYMEGYQNELETVHDFQHLGTFGRKPPYQLGTHEEDLLAREYNKLDPNVLVIASNPTTGQREGHHFLTQQHANVMSGTNTCIYGLRQVVHISSWRNTAPFPYE